MFELIDIILKCEKIDKIPLKWLDSIFSNNTLRNSINKTEISFMDIYSELFNVKLKYDFEEYSIVLDNLIDTLNRWLENIFLRINQHQKNIK
jgi:hypothetical protein